jgi:hypothetical protein
MRLPSYPPTSALSSTHEATLTLCFSPNSTTFHVDDWITHTPKSVLAKNFGLPESVFGSVPSPNPYIFNAEVDKHNVTGPNGELTGNASYAYYAKDHPLEKVPGQGGTLRIVDSTTFPVATTIAASIVTLKPGGLRELHWHPNVRFICPSFSVSLLFFYLKKIIKKNPGTCFE